MSKKKNPEQEAPPVEDQEPEIPTEQEDTPEEDTPEEDTPAQEEQPQEQDSEEQEDAQDPAEEDDPQEDPQENPQEQPPAQAPAPDETAALRNQLLQAQGELAAYRAGVAPGMVADAVTLAMAEAAKAGEVTDAAVTKAMEAVLKRHPEWKAAGESKQKFGGFKLGADRDSGGAFKKTTGNNNQNVKRWNRFKYGEPWCGTDSFVLPRQKP